MFLNMFRGTFTALVTPFRDGEIDVPALEALIEGQTRDIVLRLADYAVDRMGKPIHADELRRYLTEKTTFKLRDLSYTPPIVAAIERRRAFTPIQVAAAAALIVATAFTGHRL